MIKYSVIIPHYNIPLLLERLLNSIPARDDIEIIVVDDCSPGADNYLSKYSFLSKDNVSFIISDRNGGGGYARNIGLNNAKGKWIIFADSDDFFCDGAFDVFDKYYNCEHDVVYYNIKSVLSDNPSVEAKRADPKNLLFENYVHEKDDKLFRYYYPEPWGKMAKKDFIEKNHILFDETRVCNDYFYSMQVGCLARTIGIVDEKVYALTYREGSVSSGYADTLEKLEIRLKATLKAQLFLKNHNVFLKPMPLRGLMVLLLKKDKWKFFKTMYYLQKKGVNSLSLVLQMFNPKYMNK